jgi:hypothetical protein
MLALRMNGTVPPLLLYAFMMCTGTTSLFKISGEIYCDIDKESSYMLSEEWILLIVNIIFPLSRLKIIILFYFQ